MVSLLPEINYIYIVNQMYNRVGVESVKHYLSLL